MTPMVVSLVFEAVRSLRARRRHAVVAAAPSSPPAARSGRLLKEVLMLTPTVVEITRGCAHGPRIGIVSIPVSGSRRGK